MKNHATCYTDGTIHYQDWFVGMRNDEMCNYIVPSYPTIKPEGLDLFVHAEYQIGDNEDIPEVITDGKKDYILIHPEGIEYRMQVRLMEWTVFRRDFDYDKGGNGRDDYDWFLNYEDAYNHAKEIAKELDEVICIGVCVDGDFGDYHEEIEPQA